MDANRTTSGSELKSELARYCLPSANRDCNRKLAWVNSICILFLLVGLAGAKSPSGEIKSPPPIEEVVLTLVQPVPQPPAPPEPLTPQEEDEPKPESPRVVVATPDSPSIHFSVPTIANVVVPAELALLPPASVARVEELRKIPLSVAMTDSDGDRPRPDYPRLAQQLRQQGTVVLLIEVDERGRILGIQLKQSGGAILDRSCIDFVRQHWVMPSGPPNRVYEQPFIYDLGKLK